ncbi:hypothetical protein VCR12J2_1020202 [Vibrio coralliirubri]|nr:hypothetical protein VCR12J2_1020202 [Vibrio coralliirubri]
MKRIGLWNIDLISEGGNAIARQVLGRPLLILQEPVRADLSISIDIDDLVIK